MTATQTAPTTKPAGGPAVLGLPKLTRIQKFAVLLLILDPESAATLMKRLDQDELEAVSSEMAKFTTISKEMQQEALEEFSPVAVDVATSITGGVGCTQKLLELSVGLFRASDIISRVSPQRPLVAAMEQIAEMEPRQIFNVLRHEHLQVMALVVSFLPPEKASQLLSMVRPDRRAQVVQRLATLASTSTEVVEGVAEELQRKLSSARTTSLNYTGGVKVAAKVLNALPKNISDSIIVSLEETNSELSDSILKKMFVFEELQRLEPRTRQRILQEADLLVFLYFAAGG
jgi:flagellar motor switch protein FliG